MRFTPLRETDRPDLPGLPGQEWSVGLTDNVLILITDSALSPLSHNVFDMTRPPPTFPRANIPKLPLLSSIAALQPPAWMGREQRTSKGGSAGRSPARSEGSVPANAPNIRATWAETASRTRLQSPDGVSSPCPPLFAPVRPCQRQGSLMRGNQRRFFLTSC
jgi:hypothetical protein